MKRLLRNSEITPGWAVAFGFLGLGVVLKFVVLVLTILGVN